MNQVEFINRRKKYFDLTCDDSISIFFAGTSKKISFSADYDFIVNKNFLYLTGIFQEESILVMIKSDNKISSILFISPFDETKEKWFGKKLKKEEASEISGIKDVRYTSEFNRFINNFFCDDLNSRIINLYSESTEEIKISNRLNLNHYIRGLKRKYHDLKILDSVSILKQLRSVKSNEEIEALKKAIEITKKGIYASMANVKSGMFEYELKYLFEYECKRNGSHVLGFPSILASGKNAVCLHYPTSYDVINKGDLILEDVGASFEGYSADVTRTFPVNGKFSPRQKEIYQIVLDCNKEMISYMRPGMLLKDIKSHAKTFLAKACVEHGIIKNEGDIDNYYYHGIGHHLGLDTHDLNNDYDFISVGSVITDEPGLYIKEEGIGIRIEDDILIGEESNEVLSKDIVKEIDEIENLMDKLRQ